jgi:hypothetical protein
MQELSRNSWTPRYLNGAERLMLMAGLLLMVLASAGVSPANAQSLPADAKATCTVSATDFKSWFGGTVTANGAVSPADSINFDGTPNCSFYRWSERMFMFLTSPIPGGETFTFDSPGFFDVSPLDAMGNRTFTPHVPGGTLTFSLRAAQAGPHGLQVIFDKAGRMLEVQPPQLAPSGKQLILNKAGQVVEIERATVENGKPIFLDKAGNPILGARPVPLKTKIALQKPNTSNVVQKFMIGQKPVFMTLSGTIVDVEQGQADGSVLGAQNGSLVYYSTMVNDVFAYFATREKTLNFNDPFPTTQAELDQITAFGAVHGKTFSHPNTLAMEVKSSWVEAAGLLNPGSYITMTAKIPTYDTTNPNIWTPNGQKTVQLALVGMHVVGSTAGHKEMIWATFEHFNNSPIAAYTYNSTSGPKTVPQSTSGPWLFSANNPTAFNNAHMNTSGANIASLGTNTISPSDTIRWKAWGAASDLSPNPIDADTTASNTEILSINNNVHGMMASGDVRSNYIMTGATWTIPGQPPLPDSDHPTPADPGTQVGTSQLANTTMETYVQGQDPTATNGGSNCFSCHHTTNTSPLSHVYSALLPLPFVGAASSCQITYSCPQAIYTPPDYTVACAVPVAFFYRYPAGEMWPLGTGTTQSGTTSDYDSAVVVCDFGTTQPTPSCRQFGVGVGPANWCAPPPPPPPPPTPGATERCCRRCQKAGGDCSPNPHGCVCF